MLRKLLLTLMMLCLCVANGVQAASSAEADKLLVASEVMQELKRIPESAVPPSLMDSAQGIAIIPSVVKVGLVAAARYGKGVVLVRNVETGKWGYPMFIDLHGASLGWQIGVQSSDLILVFKNRRGVMDMTLGKMTLGIDAAVAAGPVGRDASAATDDQFNAEIYSYSRSRGLFMGISLDGTALEVNHIANANYYGEDIDIQAILDGRIGHPGPGDEVEKLRDSINQFAKSKQQDYWPIP